jgi:hypothetical protein
MGQGFRVAVSIQHIWRYTAGESGSAFDHRSAADTNPRQDKAMGPDKDIIINDYLSASALLISGAPIQMGYERCSKADRDVVPDDDGLRMQFIKIDILADPYLFADYSPSPPLQCRPQGAASGAEERDLIQQAFDQCLTSLKYLNRARKVKFWPSHHSPAIARR